MIRAASASTSEHRALRRASSHSVFPCCQCVRTLLLLVLCSQSLFNFESDSDSDSEAQRTMATRMQNIPPTSHVLTRPCPVPAPAFPSLPSLFYSAGPCESLCSALLCAALLSLPFSQHLSSTFSFSSLGLAFLSLSHLSPSLLRLVLILLRSRCPLCALPLTASDRLSCRV